MYLITYVFISLLYALATCEKTPLVQTPLGKIEGVLDKSVNGRTIYSFEGIPYARPPVGKHRFKEPVPLKPWKGIWKADTKYQCLQYNHFPRLESDPIDGTEDCLYVNVYTPNIKANLDVFVFIHGGCFIFGSGSNYHPHILLDRDVVVVTINYRLGPLGFLSTENDVVPGNNGLKDQTLALKWIRENIQYFGGNPNSVTISGMSAGGASVHFHMLTPKSRNLFHRAISMSGCMLNPWVLMEKPLERAKELANHVGCDTSCIEGMIDCLRKRPASQIVSVVGRFQPWLFNPFSPFGVVVDDWASDPVIPKHPIKLLEEKAVYDVPWIASHTTDEGLYNGFDYYEKERLKYIDEHWNEVMPHILHYNFTIKTSDLDNISNKIRKEYLGNEPLTRKNFNKLIDVIGDRLFKVDVEKCTRLHAAAIKSPVYSYVFGYRGAHSWSEFRSGTNENIGVSHGDDTIYVMKTQVDTISTEADRAMSKIMLDMFLSFAKDGKPTIGVNWTPASKNTMNPIKYLKINSPESLVNEEVDEFGNRSFWDSIPFEECENLFPVKDEL